MTRRVASAFTSVRSEGGLLPYDFLQRLAAGDKKVSGLTPQSYHLGKHERIGEMVNRSWSRLLGAWQSFKDGTAEIAASDAAVRVTRERWLLPLFQELGYGRLVASKPIEIEEHSYPISHSWQNSPIHLLGRGVNLDRRTANVAGAAKTSPHSLVQSFLNQSDAHLWGFLSNGLKLRVLRDTHSLTRQAYLEFDLEAIMEGEQYSEFLLLWIICHQSRVELRTDDDPRACWLEEWFAVAKSEGVRFLELRDGVERAIAALGAGFLRHPKNAALQGALEAGSLTVQGYYRELLRLVYRLIFLFVAEDRELLLAPATTAEVRQLYEEYYSTSRIRRLAAKRRGTTHVDLWRNLRLVMDQLAAGYAPLGLPGLGSALWKYDAITHLRRCELANDVLLGAFRELTLVKRDGVRRQVSFKELGAEELGSVYESLLELHPKIHRESGEFNLDIAAGHERKTTGSYYTPSSLVDCLLDSALDPVVERAANDEDPEQTLLDLKVCDPACGSGHFLVAAARKIAKRLAAIRTGDEEPSPEAVQIALRDVVGRCLYGVDINPMAVELCKVALWMEALEPGKPLSFLDAHIRCGNALLGTTPDLMDLGIPDDAWKPLMGDDKETASGLKKRNRAERKSQNLAFEFSPIAEGATMAIVAQSEAVESSPDRDLAELQRKETAWQALLESQQYRARRLAADAWCAAFVWPMQPGELAELAPTQRVWEQVKHDPQSADEGFVRHVRGIAARFQFFHWHLAFPTVFLGKPALPAHSAAQSRGGFDVMLGNPPWERLKLQEKEFFAGRDESVVNARNAAARKKKIAALAATDPPLFQEWQDALRKAEGESLLVRASGVYPLCGRGDINTYSIFAELNRSLMAPRGRVGCILPSGIATDDTTKYFFGDLVARRTLASLYHFENEEFVFPGVHHAYRFCLVTLTGPEAPAEEPQFVGYARQVDAVRDPERRYTLTAEDFELMNPNTRTLPVFRSRRDAEITKGIYRRVPVLVKEGATEENPWGLRFLRMFDMANDSGLFRTRQWLEQSGFDLEGNVFVKGLECYLPLYEAKMVHHFDHRFGTYEGQTEKQARQGKLPEATAEQHADLRFVSLPNYWVSQTDAQARLSGVWEYAWLVGWRRITGSEKARTMVCSVLPHAAAGDSLFLALPRAKHGWLLPALLSSFCFDYVVRQKMGGTNLSYFIVRQLPVLAPSVFEGPALFADTTLADWFRPRVVELTCTAADMAPFAETLMGDASAYRWDRERRTLLRAEIDAAFCHLYGLHRDDVSYMMDSFWVVRQRDEKAHGFYRTRQLILACFDRMQTAIDSEAEYVSELEPPAGDARIAHELDSAPGAATGEG